jgi:hypothetical protein
MMPTMTDQLIDQTNRPPTDQPERVSLEEAAARLGISTNAVRQRIKRGTLAADRSVSPWVVIWSPGRSQPTTDRPPTDQSTTRVAGHERQEVARIAELERQVTALEADRDRWYHHAEELTRLNLALTSRLPAGEVIAIDPSSGAATRSPEMALGASEQGETGDQASAGEAGQESRLRNWWEWIKRH